MEDTQLVIICEKFLAEVLECENDTINGNTPKYSLYDLYGKADIISESLYPSNMIRRLRRAYGIIENNKLTNSVTSGNIDELCAAKDDIENLVKINKGLYEKYGYLKCATQEYQDVLNILNIHPSFASALDRIKHNE